MKRTRLEILIQGRSRLIEYQVLDFNSFDLKMNQNQPTIWDEQRNDGMKTQRIGDMGGGHVQGAKGARYRGRGAISKKVSVILDE
jgi:hypothetical protein